MPLCTLIHMVSTMGNLHSTLERRFLWSLFLNGGLALGEVAASVVTGSSALLADGLMNTDDVAALLLSLYSDRKSHQGPDERRTFGYGRMDAFAGFVKGVLLLVTAFLVGLQALRLLILPEEIAGTTVIAFGMASLAVNLLSAYVLKADACCSLNARTTYSCMKYDAYGSVAVIVSGILSQRFTVVYFDVAAGLLIAGFMIKTGWAIFCDGTKLFLQSAPVDFDYAAFEKATLAIPGVTSVGDIHIWSLTPGNHHLTCKVRITVEDVCDCERILSDVERICREQFSIHHCTIQPVYSAETLTRFCSAPTANGRR